MPRQRLWYVIGVTELMRVSQQVVAATYRSFQIYIIDAAIYVIVNLGLSILGRAAEVQLRQRV